MRAIVASVAVVVLAGQARPPSVLEWRMDSLTSIGGHRVSVVGDPRVVETPLGRAIEFDGVDDGIFVDANPLEGLNRFTIEVLLQPAGDGLGEQRFLHIQEPGTANRALMELRHTAEASWALDTYLKHGDAQLTLLDRQFTHTANAWHVATLEFDGRTMTAYVDGVRESSGAVAFQPLKGGSTSIGVRQNKVSWFKGRIRSVRISADVGLPRMMPLWPEGVPGLKRDATAERMPMFLVHTSEDRSGPLDNQPLWKRQSDQREVVVEGS